MTARVPLSAALVVLSLVMLKAAPQESGRPIETTEARPAASPADRSPAPRVRSSNPYIRAMIDEATRRSATFRSLVTGIEATNGIVYVEQGSCLHTDGACLSLNVTSAGDYRMLRVIVDARRPDWDVMEAIGHELMHALEVLGDRGLKDTAGVYEFYAQGRQGVSRPFETKEAIEAGYAVRREVTSFARASLN
jgi:hypothetical protein